MKSLWQTLARWIGVATLLLAAGTGVLSCLLPGEVVLVITTDMHVPTAFNLLHVDICVVDDIDDPATHCDREDTSCPPGADCHLDITLGEPQDELTAEEQGTDLVQLPLQLGILPPSGKDKSLAIHLEASTMGGKGPTFVVDAIVTSFSPTGPKVVTIQIPYLCPSDAPDEPRTSCDMALCEKMCSPGPVLVDYPLEGLFAEERCLDVNRCFEDGELVLPVPGALVPVPETSPPTLAPPSLCKFVLPDWARPEQEINVALLLANEPSREPHGGFCTEHRCLIPMEAHWVSRTDGMLGLPYRVCEGMNKKAVAGVLAAPVTAACPLKESDVSLVDIWSSVPACRPEQPSATLDASLWGKAPGVEPLAAHAAVSLDSGDLLVIGGARVELEEEEVKVEKGSASNVVARYAGGQWTEMGTLGAARAKHTATRFAGGVLVLGGLGGDGEPLGSAEIFEPSRSGEVVFFDAEPLLQPRFDHTATPIGNDDEHILVVGGSTDLLGGLGKTEVYRKNEKPYTPWRDIAPRVGHAATRLTNGDVLVTGGVVTLQGMPPTDDVVVYGASKKAWLPNGPPMKTARAFHAAALLKDGTVLVSGGVSSGDAPQGPEASAEVYHPTYDSMKDEEGCAWTPTSPMHVARALHTMTALRDGRVLVVGGIAVNGSSPPPELYDPETDRWTLLSAPVAASRVFHTATLLTSEKQPDEEQMEEQPKKEDLVLIFGGAVLNLASMPPAMDSIVTGEQAITYNPGKHTLGPPADLPCNPSSGGAGAAGGAGGASQSGSGGNAGDGDQQSHGQVAKTFSGGGCASGRGVKRESCALSSASSSDLEGGQWTLLLVALILRRRRSR